MLNVIEEEDKIESAQRSFMRKMSELSDKRGTIVVGFKGGNEKLDADWNEEFDIWWAPRKLENRYWNAFGTKEPRWNSKYPHNITCEINPPLKGINRRIAGVFARDSGGRIYLLHRGKIGGGRKGIGKSKFWSEFRGGEDLRQEVNDGELTSTLALIGSLESPHLVSQVANFVHEVERIKTISVKKDLRPTYARPLTVFKEEFFGTKTFLAASKEIEAKCDHGVVVNTLAKQLETTGIKVGNSPSIDLFTIDEDNNPKILFEIKTDSMKDQCYKAIGQLLFNAMKLGTKPQLVAIFPATLDKESKDVIKKLGIHCLTYEWIGNKPHFARAPYLFL